MEQWTNVYKHKRFCIAWSMSTVQHNPQNSCAQVLLNLLKTTSNFTLSLPHAQFFVWIFRTCFFLTFQEFWQSNCYNFFLFSIFFCLFRPFFRVILKSDYSPNIVIACGMRHDVAFQLVCSYFQLWFPFIRILLLLCLCSSYFVTKLLYATFTIINIECYPHNNYRYPWNLAKTNFEFNIRLLSNH